ncbi:MAG: MBOAT family protein, partial [Propionibacteriaceae bacterium]|nr:MBOAT family protein [Propionibacteriaceae bacterium]
MLFSSVSFIYLFLPLALLAYFATPQPRGSLLPRNCVLLLASLIFYAWGGPGYLLIMIGQIIAAWGFGLAISRRRSRLVFVVAICVCLSSLLLFKYADFFSANLNALLHSQLPLLRFALPLGISFYTFQILSYLIDLYRGNISVQRNVVVFATYVALFPQLVAGPIVRYADIQDELSGRGHSLAG